MPKILIIEDDAAFGQMLSRYLERNGYQVQCFPGAEPAMESLDRGGVDLLLTDLRLPASDGIEIMESVKKKHPETAVIIMTGYAEVETAVSSMKKGAADYISKPFTPDQLQVVIQQALAKKRPAGRKPGAGDPETSRAKDNQPLPSLPSDKSPGISGVSEASKKLAGHIELVAPTAMSVLLTGESGTGKEVAARNIHRQSKRRKGPFVAVDCGAIPADLAASEFFGHIKGSFTGAVQDKSGYFEAAEGGTLFLDEVGNLSYENQVQLLRALQERTVRRVGGNREIPVDVRIVTATNEDLARAVREGDFREDLYHRLNEFSISIPALRDRQADIPIFAEYFLEKANDYLDRTCPGYEQDVLQRFSTYAWPGNLREFRNVVTRAVLLSENRPIGMEVLPASMQGDTDPPVAGTGLELTREEYERKRILSALEQTNYNKTQAAKLLQITRKTLYNKINRYKLTVP
ncbi:sigma-54-dependent transcriptional regulator [Robiginitalea biformata]|uniref:Putative two-component response regulator transcriptional regulatory protein n=1 Tax=Robiginitalea biformata (strain ATCC BAA-864 / DSM 15991 / KCTC 12146 / HTCC2501) TaxID=313596 RepID=A4CIV3_ROBBH|nr:sigma-54 dependent transcriptional regulator [Robiginitalea biformata]EAR16861.1 putative two-component response regulator transcriptional regulatory protein [Robiginitalea biformata HTCC2501]